MNRNRWILVGAIAVVVIGGLWFLKARSQKAAPKYRTAAVEQGDLAASVSATGSIKPVVQVMVGSQVSGTLSKLYADYNSRVKAGEILGRLELLAFQARLAQAQASVARAQAAVKDGQRVLARAQELLKGDYVAQAEVDAAELALEQRKADLKQAVAGLQSAQVDLDHTVIRAPIDGVVISRSIDVGQTVAASLSAPTLFVIANDLKNMQVQTSIDEADIGRVHPGLSVKFTVDAFPDATFQGTVSQVRLEPITDQNVVTYTTVIDTKNDDLRLKPGMTANVVVTVETRTNVLKVPNAALRFRPPGAPAGGGRNGRGAVGGGAGGGGAGAGAGLRRGFAWLFDRIAPQALAQGAPPAGGGGARSNDPFVQQVRDRVAKGELTRDQARELIHQHFAAAGAPAAGGAPGASPAPAASGAARGAKPSAGGAVGGPEGAFQTGRWAARMAPPTPGGTPYKPGQVWLLQNGKLSSLRVLTGISDGSMTEVKSDSLKVGDLVVIGMDQPLTSTGPALTPPPGMGGPTFRGGGGGGGRR